jgi:hypothetical protein
LILGVLTPLSAIFQLYHGNAHKFFLLAPNFFLLGALGQNATLRPEVVGLPNNSYKQYGDFSGEDFLKSFNDGRQVMAIAHMTLR